MTEAQAETRPFAARPGAPRLVLASASASRAALLTNAGINFVRQAARVDEDSVKDSLRAEQASVEQAAETLAELKGQRISARHPGTLVIGADQMLECGGDWLDKPPDRAAAAAQLRRLSGRSHRLIAAVCLLRDGQRLWHHSAEATLTMRPLSDDFIACYLEAAGPDILNSVGAYQLEGLGAQLFSRIEGDYFTILGLPLLPLLDILRHHGVVPT